MRGVAANMVLPAALSMIVADNRLLAWYGPGPWPSWVPRTWQMESMLMWRNYSLLLAVITSLVSVPRWQSILGIAVSILFVVYLGGQ
jgi:hypothetical protein